jgi:hypothetical protein
LRKSQIASARLPFFAQQIADRPSCRQGGFMKKPAAARRTLRLDREAIRHLSSSELEHAAGASTADLSQGTLCHTACTPCTGGGGGGTRKLE